MPSNIVDIHPHIVSRDTVRYPVTPIGGTRSEWSKERSVTLEELLAAMDEGAVDKAAIVHSSTTYGFNNDYVVDAVAAHPERFTGVFSVNVTEPDAPDRMRYWYGKGMTGMRIYARGSTIKEAWLALDDPVTFPAWECAGELGISVATNMHGTGAGLEQIKSTLKRFPRVCLIIDHLGRPPVEDGPPYDAAKDYFALANFPNCYLKLTPSGLNSVLKGKATADTLVPKLVSVFGADRIAWGSNYPASPGTMGEIVAASKLALRALSDADRNSIFAKTAQHLYPILQD
ncbi:MAG TPA: amidohydrolase family protein [Xanthobacteraceae bacterium]